MSFCMFLFWTLAYMFDKVKTWCIVGTSLVVQWLRLHALNAGGIGSVPGWGTKILHTTSVAQIT